MEIRHIFIILGMFLCSTVGGMIVIPGTIAPYIVSYYHSYNPSISLADISIIQLFGSIIQVNNFYLLSYLIKKYRKIYLLITGLLIGTVSMFFCSYIADPYIFIFAFGAVTGILACYLVYCSVWIGWELLPANDKGFAAGLGLSGFSMSPFIYGFVFTLIINPNNDRPTETEEDGDFKEKLFGKDVYESFPMTIRYLSIILLVVGLVGAFFLNKKSEKQEEKASISFLPFVKIIKLHKFWYIFVFGFFKNVYYFFVIMNYRTLGLLYINDDYFLSYVTTISFVLGSVSRIIIGKLFDLYSWRTINIVVAMIEIFTALVYFYILEYKYLFGLVTIVSIAISNTSYLAVWILTEKVFQTEKNVFPVITWCFVLGSLMIYFFNQFIIPVSFT